MNLNAKIRKEINEDKLMVFGIIFILVFDFILFPLPILAKNSTDADNLGSNEYLVFNVSGNINRGLIGKKEVEQFEIIKIEPKPINVLSLGYHGITAYTSEVAQTDNDPCTTANGFNLCKHGQEDSIAANFLKFNTKVRIPELFGDHVFIVRDRMNRRHPDRLDIWFKDKDKAIRFGYKVAKIEVIE